MQVDPIKPTLKPPGTKLKPPGTKHLKLKFDELLSNLAFQINLRRYSEGTFTSFINFGDTCRLVGGINQPKLVEAHGQGITLVHIPAQLERFLWNRGCN